MFVGNKKIPEVQTDFGDLCFDLLFVLGPIGQSGADDGFGFFQIRFGQLSSGKIGLAEIGPGQSGPFELGTPQVGTNQVAD